MSSFWLKAFELIFSLGLLVFVHEFGHYIFSRIFGVKVEKFYLFFNPWFELVKFKPKPKPRPDGSTRSSWRDTEYGIGWVPLGGYCKIAGMIDESMDTEQMKKPAQPWEFRSKPAWQRLLIMVGGVLFNFLLAIVIYSGIVYTYGEQFIPFRNATEGMAFCDSAHKIGFQDGDIPLSADNRPLGYYNAEDLQTMLTAKVVKVLRNHKDTVDISIPSKYIFTANKDAEQNQIFMTYRIPVVISQLQARMGAETAGLKVGDRLIAVNSDSTPSYDLFTEALQKNKGKVAQVTYVRAGKTATVNAQIDGDGKLGIMLTEPTKVYKTVTKQYSIFQSIPRGIEMGWSKLVSYVKQLKLVFTPEGAKSIGGFGAIGSIFPSKWNWLAFWEITALISVMLAVMNILPIPALDGGYVLFLIIEIITRRKPSEKFMERAVTGGMIFLLLLLVFANGNDIYRFFFK